MNDLISNIFFNINKHIAMNRKAKSGPSGKIIGYILLFSITFILSLSLQSCKNRQTSKKMKVIC